MSVRVSGTRHRGAVPRVVAISVRGLTKRFGDLVAVDGLTFDVAGGEFFGLLGPNGAGKTTTIRMLEGILRPTAGEARIMGFDVGRESLAARELLGIVPDTANAYVELSAWKNVNFAGELYGVPRVERERRARQLLNRFGLDEHMMRPVRGFSRGMKQRLLLCMALVSDPQVLLLDEPTTGLDVQSARLIRTTLTELNREGRTVLLTTHNMEEAGALCKRVAIINRGRLVTVDRPQRLRRAAARLQAVDVVFTGEVDRAALADLPGVGEVRVAGEGFHLVTESPGDLVAHLVDLARARGVGLSTVNVSLPSLEDVFVELTGGGTGP